MNAPKPSLGDRVQGCLLGAAIGSELGYGAACRPEILGGATPADLFDRILVPAVGPQDDPRRIDRAKMTPFIDVGVRAYVEANGRATPEQLGELIREDEALAAPVFTWDDIHTTQELLKEGMQPRLTGLGISPSGNIAAAMPAVGIYHFADPEAAYLDGVELASVTQPRVGADWAALCAAAVAAAFEQEASPQSVVDAVLHLALRNNKDLFYEINSRLREASWAGDDAAFLAWWLAAGGRTGARNALSWIAPNPIGFVLPLLARFGSDPARLMAALIAPGQWSSAPVVAGAILGALHGVEVWRSEWRVWAEPIIKPWRPLLAVVEGQVEREARQIEKIGRLSMGRPQLSDKVYGCLLAGAIGNAMGSPVEGRFYWEIDERWPEGIQTVLDPRNLESEDDNQMAMLLVETYLDRAGLPVTARHFGDTWLRKLNRNHFHPMCMGNAYDLICAGWDPRITGHWSVVTGSTVMCMEPVGIYHLCDSEAAAQDATSVSYMYQRGRDVEAAAIIAAATAAAFDPDATVESVCAAALAAAPDRPTPTFDRRPYRSVREYLECCLEIASRYDDVFKIRAELYEKCLLYHQIDPIELTGFALAMFKVSNGDVRLSAIGGTNIGRDSDTIAGRAAMLSGALRGVNGVPAEWVALFAPSVLEKILRNAERFAEILAGPRVERIRRRQVAVGSPTGAAL